MKKVRVLLLSIIVILVGVSVVFAVKYFIKKQRYKNESFVQGKLEQKAGNYALAAEKFSKFIEQYPEDPEGYISRGSVYLCMKDYPKANGDYFQATDLDPENGNYYYLAGNSLFEQNNYYRAVEKYSDAIKYKSDSLAVYFKRGVCYFETTDYTNSIKDMDAYLQANDEAKGYFYRGYCKFKTQDYNNALNDLSKSITLDPKSCASYGLRASAYIQIKKYDAAIKDYTAILELKPDSSEIYFKRGETYAKEGLFQFATGDINEFLKKNPYVSYAYVNQGYYYFEAGENDSALTYFDKAYTFDRKTWEPAFGAAIIGYTKNNIPYTKRVLQLAELINGTTISNQYELDKIEGDKWNYLKKRNALLPAFFNKMQGMGHITFY